MSAKKTSQLGMHPATAAHRLRADIMFSFAVRLGYVCFRCSQPLKRVDFSVEHKVPWLDSSDPVRLFFDLDNIGFSHLSCNVGSGRRYKMSKEHRQARLAKTDKARYERKMEEHRAKIAAKKSMRP